MPFAIGVELDRDPVSLLQGLQSGHHVPGRPVDRVAIQRPVLGFNRDPEVVAEQDLAGHRSVQRLLGGQLHYRHLIAVIALDIGESHAVGNEDALTLGREGERILLAESRKR